MKLRHFLLTSAVLLSSLLMRGMERVIDGVEISDYNITHNGDYLTIDMTLDLSNLKVGHNRAVLITPILINGNDSVLLKGIGVYGRERYYHYVRNGESMLSNGNEVSYRSSKKPSAVNCDQILKFEDWMNGATLELRRQDYGCCNTLLGEQLIPIGDFFEQTAFFPTLVFMNPKGEIEKHRSLEGSAFIDFPVDQTIIYPDYRRNTVELGKIQATIDSVRNDNDVTITQVWLKGFASPESPYKHNTELAIGRTAALKNYIQQLYHFAPGIIATDYEPEDWAGLRRFVENSNIDHRSEILALIDSDMEPDAKEAKIKKTYPAEYRFMLQNFYPALRHTDYRIAYDIRQFNDVDEIKKIMETQPNKLGLNELYLLAEQYEPGSDEFTDVYETAVRLYPEDEVANINAANASIRRDDFTSAEKYLKRAGDSKEADYARAALEIRRGDIEAATKWLEKADAAGLKQAADTLEDLNKRNNKK